MSVFLDSVFKREDEDVPIFREYERKLHSTQNYYQPNDAVGREE